MRKQFLAAIILSGGLLSSCSTIQEMFDSKKNELQGSIDQAASDASQSVESAADDAQKSVTDSIGMDFTPDDSDENLTAMGKNVKVVFVESAVSDCTAMGEQTLDTNISSQDLTDLSGGGKMQQKVVALVRNKTAELGADTVLLSGLDFSAKEQKFNIYNCQ